MSKRSSKSVKAFAVGVAALACTAAAPAGAQAACGLPNIARMWDNGGCGGSYLSMYQNDSINPFSAYGWDNKVSSAEAGKCQSIKMWTGTNYGGSVQPVSAGSYISQLSSTFANKISSSKSYANAAC